MKIPRSSRFALSFLLLCLACCIPLHHATAAMVPKLQLHAGTPAPVVAINMGDNAWMLISTALVLMMTAPGLVLFYGGLVRTHNVLATMMQSFLI